MGKAGPHRRLSPASAAFCLDGREAGISRELEDLSCLYVPSWGGEKFLFCPSVSSYLHAKAWTSVLQSLRQPGPVAPHTATAHSLLGSSCGGPPDDSNSLVSNQIPAIYPDPCPVLLFWLMEPVHQVFQCFLSPTGLSPDSWHRTQGSLGTKDTYLPGSMPSSLHHSHTCAP